MLMWEAKFQIPNSDKQSAVVYAAYEHISLTEIVVKFYADKEKTVSLFDKNYMIPSGVIVEEYLLTLDEFSEYQII